MAGPTDAEVTSLLTLNDKTKKLWSSYGTVIDDVGSSVGVSLDVGTLFLMASFMPSSYSVVDRMRFYEWSQNSSGAIKPDYTPDSFLLPIGRFMSWMGKFLGIGAKGGVKALQQFNSVESLIQGAGHLTKVKAGMQGFIKGDGVAIFKTISQGGIKQANGTVLMKDGTTLFNHFSTKTGVYTIDVNKAGQIYKIRVMQ